MKACPGLRSGIDGSNSLSLIIRDIPWSLRPLNSSFSRTRESRGGVRASTRNSLVENNANDKPRNMSATQSVALGLVPSLGRTARSRTLHGPACHHFHPLMRPSQGHGDSRDQKHAPYPDTGRESRGGAAGAPVPHGVAMGRPATTYGPCSITICKRAGQITLKSEQLQDGRLPLVDRASVILSK